MDNLRPMVARARPRFLHGPGPQLEVSAFDLEDTKAHRVAPGEELAQVAQVARSGGCRVTGQKASHGHAGLVEQWRGGADDGGAGHKEPPWSVGPLIALLRRIVAKGAITHISRGFRAATGVALRPFPSRR